MLIKEYEAQTLKDCLQQVRNELGPDAVILDTRKNRKGGLLGFGARELVCVVAATGIQVKEEEAQQQKPSRANPDPLDKKEADVIKRVSAARPAAARLYRLPETPAASSKNGHSSTTAHSHEEQTIIQHPPAQPVARQTPPSRLTLREETLGTERLETLERAMNEIRDALNSLQKERQETEERTVSAVVSALSTNSVSDFSSEIIKQETHYPDLFEKLIQSGVNETLAKDLLESLPDVSAWSEPARKPMAISALRDLISRRLPCSGPLVTTPGQLKAVALIGPTGVGKTTTIAKLAAHFALVEHKKVALLTVDTYRIAAVEQLKTYGQIMDIPLRVAYDHSEVAPAIAEFADYDLLLIDTAGRSQKNIMQVGELKGLLERMECETHLVLSSTMKEADMIESVERFSKARVDRLLFSKLDETSSCGSLLSVTDRVGIPISYITTGQKVPEDLEVADSRKMARMILED